MSMYSPSKLTFAAVVAAVAVVAGLGTAEARRAWNTYGRCYPAIESVATGNGILGLGSARARESARANWEQTAENLHGPGFGDLSRARNVRWDCKKGAILLAKCVVVAQPCAARLRG